MPRKNIYTHEFPYHITARVNNQEWFSLDRELVWCIFQEALNTSKEKFGIKVHAFILMDNHYHLIASVNEKYPLSIVMKWLQYHLTIRINYYAKSINHIFGGRYKASLITTERYYYHAIKYLYRNSVASGLSKRVEDYPFSTLNSSKIILQSPTCGIDGLLPKDRLQFYSWLNNSYGARESIILSKAIKKPQFRFPKRLPKKLEKSLCHS